MFRLFYQALSGLALLLAAPFLLLVRGRHYLATVRGRLTLDLPPADDSRPLWIHAVSVGETGVAATLARALPDDLPLVVTTVTPTGQAQARKLFAARVDAGSARVAYLPFDFGLPVRRFFQRVRPSALLLVEGDYWPIVLEEARRGDVPVAVINGRLSRRSADRLKRLPRALQRRYFAPVDLFGVQTDEDRERLLALGVDEKRVVRTGNLKYDTPEPEPLTALEDELRRLADGRPILIAGSTMRDEEEHVLDAFARVGAQRAMLLLVPRHPERWDGVAGLVEQREFSLVRRSLLDDAGDARPDVVLLDSLGELSALYRVAASAFIGGTLVPTGGHNPLEPACFAVPIVVGPSMHNFAEMEQHFQEADAWLQVDDSEGLAEAWIRALDDPENAADVGRRGADLLRRHRGAVRNTLQMLDPLLHSTD